MENPQLITIVTVCLNNLEGLKRTYASISQQNYKNFQWIVVDGGSKDGARDFLMDTDALWHSEPDRGIYDAMNKGLARATGDYVIFMNAGDEFYDSSVLEIVAHTIRSAGHPDFIYGDSSERMDNSVIFNRTAKAHNGPVRGMFTCHQSMFYRRVTIGDLRYSLNYPISGDYDFTLRFLRQSDSAVYVPQSFCIFDSGGLSQQKPGMGRREQFKIRQELGIVTPAQNAFIYAAQTALWELRAHAPALYRLVQSCRKSAHGSAQMPGHDPHP